MSIATTGWKPTPRRSRQALAAVLLTAAALGAQAAQTSASFKVIVDLITEQKNTGQCDRNARPGTIPSVSIMCATSNEKPRLDLFHLNLYESGRFLGTVDGMMSTGTVTSWRVIHVANRDYLEIMVGW